MDKKIDIVSPEIRKEARRSKMRLASFMFAILAVISPSLPFIHLVFDDFSVHLSGYLSIISSIRVSETELVEFPAGMRISLIPALFLVVTGTVLTFLKRHIAASGSFFASFILGVVLSGYMASLRTGLLNAGCSTANVSVQFGWLLFLLNSMAAAVMALLISGIEKSAETIFKMTAFISVGAVAIITVYMFASGLPAIFEIGFGDFIFGSKWAPVAEEPSFGILYMILTSIIGCVGAILIGVPIGLLTAVFLSEIAPNWIARVIRPAVELLAGIPSVIYGFWGMKVLVPFIRKFFTGLGYNSTGSGLTAVIVILSIMILPTIVRVAETALKSVPISYTEAALALGNTKISTIFSVQIPAARSGILAGVILGVGRAIGETMAVIMVAGNIVQFPTLFSSVRPMTAGIAFEMGYAEAGLHRQALFAIGLVLFVLIMIVNISFSYISKKGGEVK